MACDLTSGRQKVCKNSIGGVGKAWLINFIEDAVTVVNGVVTGFNALVTEAFPYELEGDGNNIAESLVPDRNSGTSINTQTTTMVLKKIDAETSLEMNMVAYNSPILIAKDRNGVYHAIGIDDGIDFTVAQTTGGAKTELNGYTLTGISTTGALSPKLNSDAIADLLALVA